MTTTSASWRQRAWARVTTGWDVVVVGGGITGAAVLREAAGRGLKALLLEQGDFASGASSRSSKLVHGGLRYLAQGAVGLTWASVRERDRLLAELPGLVEPIGFLLAAYRRDALGPRALGVGLTLYDWLGQGAPHRRLAPADLSMLAPRLSLDGLAGAFWYRDAQTDDARLVVRTLLEGADAGGEALSRARVEELSTRDGRVTGVVVRDLETGATALAPARAVVNATGAWADALRAEVGGRPVMRPLRGSHLLFPQWRFPVAQAVAFRHPRDGRPLFAYPWEGLTLLGTTDRDHPGRLEEPVMTTEEARYLVEAARGAFPELGLEVRDAVASYAGVRPVVGTGVADPSKESREHVVWNERGLVTVTGGKLTTFRALAREALGALEKLVPGPRRRARRGQGAFSEAAGPTVGHLEPHERRRLEGRHGRRAAALCEAARPGELTRVGDTAVLWAELRWALRAERVVHLEDVLLRRVRLGLVLPEGGRELLPRVSAMCREELGWDARRWGEEVERYQETWQRQHRAPVVSGATETSPAALRASAAA